MQIAILVKEFPPTVIGGTELQTLEMATELTRQTDHDVTVFTKAYPEETPDVPFEIIRIPNLRVSPFLSTLSFVIIGIFYLIRHRHRIDILQSMMIYPTGFMGLVLNRVTGIPYFAWIRGGDYYLMKDHPVKRWSIKSVLDDTLVLVQSEGIRGDVLDEFPKAKEIRVLGNGVRIPDGRAAGEHILYIGRLHAKKGLDVLLQAMEGLNEKLLIVGDGSERAKLESLAAQLDLDVKFKGEVPHERVSEFFKQGKVFVLPSIRGEGLPNAILEAMAFGLPVIATDSGGVADLIIDGETGYVVPPNDVEALRDRLSHVCENEGLRDELAKQARQHVAQSHSWSAILQDLELYYYQLIEESQADQAN